MTPRAQVKRVRKAAGVAGANADDESDRRKNELIALGKARGFLTYDEVSAREPAGPANSQRVADWPSAFAREDIELVDSPPSRVGSGGAAPGPSMSTVARGRMPPKRPRRRGTRTRTRTRNTPTRATSGRAIRSGRT